MTETISWPVFGRNEFSDRVQYRACSQKTAWRIVNNHQSVWGALFSAEGAKALFTEGTRLHTARKANNGTPYYVVVWEAGEDWVLLTNGVYVVRVESEEMK